MRWWRMNEKNSNEYEWMIWENEKNISNAESIMIGHGAECCKLGPCLATTLQHNDGW